MKRILVLFLAVALCASLCACGNPLEKEYSTIDEVVQVLAENYSVSKEINEIIQANPSIAQYFHKDHLDDEIWKKLREVTGEDGNPALSMTEIHTLYNVCNQENGFDDWFEFINIPDGDIDKPFIMYGNSGMTIDELTESISRKFKDPDSVSIKNAWVCFELPDGAEAGDGFTLFEEGCRYVILAEISAKNGFGAYDTAVFVIEGSVKWSGWTFSVNETSSSISLLTKPTADYEGYGEWSRIL